MDISFFWGESCEEFEAKFVPEILCNPMFDNIQREVEVFFVSP